MLETLAIQPIDKQQLPRVIALARATWPVAYAGILTPEQIENMLETIYTPENLSAEMASGHRFWLAEEGFVSAYIEGETIWIKKLYVLPAAQGRGLGKSLLQTAITAFLPAQKVSLLVNPNNTPAMAFYESRGFARSGTKPVKMGDFDFCDVIYSAAPQTLLKA